MSANLSENREMWFGRIPEHWTTCKFKSLIAKSNAGEVIDRSHWHEGNELLFTCQRDPMPSRYPGFPEHKRTKTNDLLVTRNGTPYVHLPPEGSIYSNVVQRCSLKNGVGRKFVAQSLSVACETLNREGYGVSIASFSFPKWCNLTLPVPPIDEQDLIVAYLDEVTGKVDHSAWLRRRQMELLREQRAALIQEAVTRGLDKNAPVKDSGLPWLGEIPEHWRVERNKVIFREIDLRSSDGSEELLTVSHITGVTPRAQKEEVNMFLAESNEGYKQVEIGDLAINTMWAWMGALGFSKYRGIVSPSYNVYKFRQAADPDYFELLFRSPNFIKEIIRYSTGVWESRLRLYPKAFFEIRSPIPPLEEQKEIVEHVEQITRQTEAILSAYSRQLELLTEYRAALIRECVTGQRAVPASGTSETP